MVAKTLPEPPAARVSTVGGYLFQEKEVQGNLPKNSSLRLRDMPRRNMTHCHVARLSGQALLVAVGGRTYHWPNELISRHLRLGFLLTRILAQRN